MAPPREWFEKDYYKVLGVASTAAAKEITKRVPEAGPGEPPRRQPRRRRRRGALQGDLRRVRRARRRREAQGVRRGPQHGPGGRRSVAAGRGGFRFNTGDVNFGDGGLGDILGQTCSAAAAAARSSRRRVRRRERRPAPPRRGPRGRAAPRLRRTPCRGITTTLHLTSDAPCYTCRGTGAEPGTSPIVCPHCGGRGVVDDNQGFFAMSPPCPRCPGARRRHRAPVPDLPRQRRRAPAPRGQGPHPGRVSRRPAHPAQGPRRPRPQRRPARRPLRRVPRRPAPPVRPRRQEPHASRCRSPSPRPRSGPTSRCRRSTDQVSLRLTPGTRPARTSGSRARASPAASTRRPARHRRGRRAQRSCPTPSGRPSSSSPRPRPTSPRAYLGS